MPRATSLAGDTMTFTLMLPRNRKASAKLGVRCERKTRTCTNKEEAFSDAQADNDVRNNAFSSFLLFHGGIAGNLTAIVLGTADTAGPDPLSSSTAALPLAVAPLQGNNNLHQLLVVGNNSVMTEMTPKNSKAHQEAPPPVAMTLPHTPASGAAAPHESSDKSPGSSSKRTGGTTEEADHLDPEDKVARNRERNREHARKTRLRKKAQLEALQSRAKGLEAERQVLRQQIEDCSIASILLGLSSGSSEPDTDSHHGVREASSQFTATAEDDSSSKSVAWLTGGTRKRFILNATGDRKIPPLQLHIDGQLALIGGGKSQVNWKTGSYVDEGGKQNRLTEDQLEHLRCVFFQRLGFRSKCDRQSLSSQLASIPPFPNTDASEIACTLR